MRSHAYTAVGESVPQAVYRAVYTMRNCEIELSARILGEPTFLSAGEAKACERTISAQIVRAWDLWLKQCPSPPTECGAYNG
jgi:ribulose-5-phosphate 4-epimerase/fuculose-1-phosphate aldolase